MRMLLISFRALPSPFLLCEDFLKRDGGKPARPSFHAAGFDSPPSAFFKGSRCLNAPCQPTLDSPLLSPHFHRRTIEATICALNPQISTVSWPVGRRNWQGPSQPRVFLNASGRYFLEARGIAGASADSMSVGVRISSDRPRPGR
jgi:hypothetical protein